jgi:hypothetical protein
MSPPMHAVARTGLARWERCGCFAAYVSLLPKGVSYPGRSSLLA